MDWNNCLCLWGDCCANSIRGNTERFWININQHNIGADIHQDVVVRKAIDPSQGLWFLARKCPSALLGRPAIVAHRKDRLALVANSSLPLEGALKKPTPQLRGLGHDLRREPSKEIGYSHYCRFCVREPNASQSNSADLIGSSACFHSACTRL